MAPRGDGIYSSEFSVRNTLGEGVSATLEEQISEVITYQCGGRYSRKYTLQ